MSHSFRAKIWGSQNLPNSLQRNNVPSPRHIFSTKDTNIKIRHGNLLILHTTNNRKLHIVKRNDLNLVIVFLLSFSL